MPLAEEIATVSFIKDGYAYLKTSSVSACSSCSAKSACGARTISQPSSTYNLRLENKLDLKKGDSVILGMESNRLLLGTVSMYILPLIMLFIFSYIGKILAGELTSILGGVLGLFGGLSIIRFITSKDNITKQFEPKIICKYDENSPSKAPSITS